MLFAVACEVGEELDRAQKDQDRLQDELEVTCEGMVTASKEFSNCWALPNAACANVTNTSAKLNGAFREFSNCRATHEAVCAGVMKASQRTAVLKRTHAEAHEKTRSHRERCRRVTNDHTRSEATVNHSLGFLEWCLKETATATHSLTCGVPDRESNEIRYLKEAKSSSRSDRNNFKGCRQ